MQSLEGGTAYTNLMNGVRAKTFRYPGKTEAGYCNGYLLPKLSSAFKISSGDKVFTIGSCFAREIETILLQCGCDVPVSRFGLPEGEFEFAPSHLLNEYNAGTILQRVDSTFGAFEYIEDMGIEEIEGGFIDLFLHIHQRPVTKERLLERRRQIAMVYEELKSSSALVMTLGLAEAWYDNQTGCFLNKAPSRAFVKKHPGRFFFQRMDFDDVYKRIKAAIERINSSTKINILLTISPIPIEATFSGDNAVIANTYSKSILRASAQLLSEEFENVAYFPSYEIATSKGTAGFHDDNIHVTRETVETIMKYLADNYLNNSNAAVAETAPPSVINYIDEEIEQLSR